MKCRACGVDHSPLIRCEVFNRANLKKQVEISRNIAREVSCATEANDPQGVVEGVSADGDTGDEKKKALGKSGNRRERAVYNAYQREYMRAWRKRKKC